MKFFRNQDYILNKNSLIFFKALIKRIKIKEKGYYAKKRN